MESASLRGHQINYQVYPKYLDIIFKAVKDY